MSLRVLDPRQTAEGEALRMAPALASLDGAVIGLLDNAKIGTGRFYDFVAEILSEQYGVRLQFAGHRYADDEVRIVEGDPADRSFLAVYERAGEPVAVLGMDQPRLFTRWRRQLRAAVPTAP